MSEWINVAPAAELQQGQAKVIDVDGVDIAVINIDGEYFAIEDVCSHDGSPMIDCGLEPAEVLDGDQLICPRHGARFCIRSGAALTPPAYEPVATFPIRVEDGMVQTRDDRWD